MSANVVNDPSTVIESDRPHKSSMSLTRSTADKASSVPRRRLVIDIKILSLYAMTYSLTVVNDIQSFHHFNTGQSTKRNTEKVFALSLITNMLEDDFFLLLFPYMDLETLLIRLLPKVNTN